MEHMCSVLAFLCVPADLAELYFIRLQLAVSYSVTLFELDVVSVLLG